MGDPAGVKAMSASALAIARLHDSHMSLSWLRNQNKDKLLSKSEGMKA